MRTFGDLEAEIMDAVWEADSPLSVREVLTRIGERRTLAYTTVQTVAEILHRKGWLNREKDGRAWRYSASASREEYTAGLIETVLDDSADRKAALMKFVEGLDPHEIDELSAAVARSRRMRRQQP